ncbi:MAG: RNA polymerase sigma factor [Terriglobales bacterium]
MAGEISAAAAGASAEVAAVPVEQNWEALVWTHVRTLYRIAFAELRNHHDAEDAVQETLQRAWKYRHRLAQVESPEAWLARIAWRVAKSHRSRVRTVSLDDQESPLELPAAGVAADELASGRQLRRLAAQFIQHLPAKLRRPLVLSTVEELSAREIGQILNIPESSVRTRCLRARRMLRDKLAVALQKGEVKRESGS